MSNSDEDQSIYMMQFNHIQDLIAQIASLEGKLADTTQQNEDLRRYLNVSAVNTVLEARKFVIDLQGREIRQLKSQLGQERVYITSLKSQLTQISLTACLERPYPEPAPEIFYPRPDEIRTFPPAPPGMVQQTLPVQTWEGPEQPLHPFVSRRRGYWRP